MKIGTQLPTRYEKGLPEVNCFMAILVKAQKDGAQMWLDYEETEFYKRDELRRSKGLCISVDAETLEAVAYWVSKYIGG